MLYNYKDTPADLFTRVRDLLAWGVAAYPMRFQPLSGDFAFDKDSYTAPTWANEELEMVAKARRVIGYGGAFPPHEGLVKKFYNAKSFEEAFGLYVTRGLNAKPSHKPKTEFELKEFAWDLIEMGKDHQFPTDGVAKLTSDASPAAIRVAGATA